jgi:hypothetical protein
MPAFTLLQAAILCGQLESTSKCNRWIRPYFFSIQNTIRAALTEKWAKVQGFYKRKAGVAATRAKCNLPKHLERRLIPLIARDKALLLWHSKSTFPVLAHVQKDIALMIDWLRDPAVLWEKSIAHWIPGRKLPPSDPDFIHINVLEFVVVLIQLAACITALETDYAKSMCGDTLPQIPHLWVWTDNESSKSWANRLTTASPKAQPLLGILSRLLQRNNIRFESGHIAGASNDGPDWISRPDLAPSPALTHFYRSQQIIMNDKRLKSWAFFRPTPSFFLLLASALFCGRWAAPPSLRKTLGHFEALCPLAHLLLRSKAPRRLHAQKGANPAVQFSAGALCRPSRHWARHFVPRS